MAFILLAAVVNPQQTLAPGRVESLQQTSPFISGNQLLHKSRFATEAGL